MENLDKDEVLARDELGYVERSMVERIKLQGPEGTITVFTDDQGIRWRAVTFLGQRFKRRIGRSSRG